MWSAEKEAESRTGTKTQHAVFAHTVPHRPEQGSGLQRAYRGGRGQCKGSWLPATMCRTHGPGPVTPLHCPLPPLPALEGTASHFVGKAHRRPSSRGPDGRLGHLGCRTRGTQAVSGGPAGGLQGLATQGLVLMPENSGPPRFAFCIRGGSEIPAVWSKVGLYVIQPPASCSESVRQGQEMRVGLVPVTNPSSVSLGSVPTTDTLSSCSSPV